MTNRSGGRKVSLNQVNRAVAAALFSEEMAGRPVYALPGDGIPEQVAESLGVEPKQGRYLIRSVAARQIGIKSAVTRPFEELAEQHWTPSTAQDVVPPGVCVMVALTWAAESMRDDGDFAANNYYERLHTLLDTPAPRRTAVVDGYRKHAEVLWGRLNAWLEFWEGSRGVPTAYAAGSMRFIGLPLSQAVLRHADRLLLQNFFVEEALPAGYSMPASEIEVLIDGWMTRGQLFGATLRSLWGNSSARERIAEAASLELESWDGAGADDMNRGAARSGRALLTGALRVWPQSMLDLGLALPRADRLDHQFVLEGEGGGSPVNFVSGSAGRLQLATAGLVDSESLLMNEIVIRDEGSSFERKPRRVVPLRLDELAQTYVEVETIQLGERSLVLTADDLKPRVERILAENARPGWSELPVGFSGVPSGWSAFKDVEMVQRGTDTRAELNPLLPRASTAVSLVGGAPLPGLLRKWSSLNPPELNVVATGAQEVRAEIASVSGARRLIKEISVAGSALVAPLADLSLADGEYQIAVYLDGANKPTATSLVRLRSAATPEVHKLTNLLVHRPDSGSLWPFIAVPPDGDRYVDGARVYFPTDPVPAALTQAARTFVARSKSSVQTEQAPLFAIGTAPAADSCVRTGAHHFEFPTFYLKPEKSTISGVCSGCGMVKRSPSTPYGAAAKRRQARVQNQEPFDVNALPAIEPITFEAGIMFDSLCHVGHGSTTTMSKILGESDDSALARWNYLRRLQAVGHIDLELNPRTLDIEAWEVAPSTLLEVDEGTYVLLGRRTQSELANLTRVVGQVGGTVTQSDDQRIPRITVNSTDIDAVLDDLRPEWDDLEVSDAGAALRLAMSLPRLSSVADSLPMTPVMDEGPVEMWDNSTAKWIRTRSMSSVGAYRVGRYSRRYILRSSDDLSSGTVRQATAELAKHVAAMWAGDPLVGYLDESSMLIAPIGAELPGLYGRAACLPTARLPLPIKKHPYVTYKNVSAELAAVISDRLSN